MNTVERRSTFEATSSATAYHGFFDIAATMLNALRFIMERFPSSQVFSENVQVRCECVSSHVQVYVHVSYICIFNKKSNSKKEKKTLLQRASWDTVITILISGFNEESFITQGTFRVGHQMTKASIFRSIHGFFSTKYHDKTKSCACKIDWCFYDAAIICYTGNKETKWKGRRKVLVRYFQASFQG